MLKRFLFFFFCTFFFNYLLENRSYSNKRLPLSLQADLNAFTTRFKSILYFSRRTPFFFCFSRTSGSSGQAIRRRRAVCPRRTNRPCCPSRTPCTRRSTTVRWTWSVRFSRTASTQTRADTCGRPRRTTGHTRRPPTRPRPPLDPVAPRTGRAQPVSFKRTRYVCFQKQIIQNANFVLLGVFNFQINAFEWVTNFFSKNDSEHFSTIFHGFPW